jgi:hypothetical protein
MAKDISKKTVALLVVLAIILSVFLTLMNLGDSAPEAEPITEDSAGAQVTVVVVEPVEEGAQVQVNVVEEK